KENPLSSLARFASLRESLLLSRLSRQGIRFGVFLDVGPDVAEGGGDVAAHFVDRRKFACELVDAQHVAGLALWELTACREDHAALDRDLASEQAHRGHAVVELVLRIAEGIAALLADHRPIDHLIAAEDRAR